MPKQPAYKFVVGEEKDINATLIGGETRWKPILMSAIPRERVPNGLIYAVMFEQIVD